MQSRVHPLWVLVASALLGAATCSNSNGKAAADPAKPLTSTPTAAPAGKQAAPPPTPAAPAITTFPKADLAGLTDKQKALFAAVANDEFCPCDCPVTLAACLQDKSNCPAAPLMAEAITRSIRLGMPADMLREEVTEGFSGGYSAKKNNLIMDGYGAQGPASAPIVIVEYSDFECPHCAEAAPLLKSLVKKYPGEVRLVFKHFPLSGHVMAKDAAVAVEAAGRQGRFWEMHDKVFANQLTLSPESIRALARGIGLDMKRFEADIVDPTLAGRVEASRKEGETLGINSTPSVFVNGRRFGLHRSEDNFDTRIRMERVRGQGSCN